MIYLLGSSGYIGESFVTELTKRGIPFQGLSRRDFDYTSFRELTKRLVREKPEMVIHAAGFTGKPNVDACENQRGETLAGNLSLTQTVAQACATAGVRMGYVSSGCVYIGVKVKREDGVCAVEDRLTEPLVSELLATRSCRIEGFHENDLPNFTFTQNNCSFYSGTKALAEEVMRAFPEFYVWRLRIPFDEYDGPRNYLSKVQNYPKVYQNWNSLSHRGDFASACLDLWEKGADGGIYNLTNPGYTSTTEVVEKIRSRINPDWRPAFWNDDAEFYRFGAKAARSNCILDCEKALRAGARLRPLEEALEDALSSWVKI